MPSGSDVAAPEVGDNVNRRQLGQQRRRVKLHAKAELRSVPYRLTVSADRANLRAGHASTLQYVFDDSGVQMRQIASSNAAALYFVRPGTAKRR
jgi:hypothetical protein